MNTYFESMTELERLERSVVRKNRVLQSIENQIPDGVRFIRAVEKLAKKMGIRLKPLSKL